MRFVLMHTDNRLGTCYCSNAIGHCSNKFIIAIGVFVYIYLSERIQIKTSPLAITNTPVSRDIKRRWQTTFTETTVTASQVSHTLFNEDHSLDMRGTSSTFMNLRSVNSKNRSDHWRDNLKPKLFFFTTALATIKCYDDHLRHKHRKVLTKAQFGLKMSVQSQDFLTNQRLPLFFTN